MCTFIACREGEPGHEAISYIVRIVHPMHSYVFSFLGNSGLVYCGYLEGVDNRDVVAIKTCKGTKFEFNLNKQLLYFSHSSFTCK